MNAFDRKLSAQENPIWSYRAANPILCATRCFKGGSPKPPKPPKPPAPSKAAENVIKSKVLDRQRKARGFQATILTGTQINPPAQPSLLNSLLGQ